MPSAFGPVPAVIVLGPVSMEVRLARFLCPTSAVKESRHFY
jgi:hypothetical protein